MLPIWISIAAIIIAAIVFANWYASTWDRALTGYFGIVGKKAVQTSEEITRLEAECTAEVVSEGTVLLKNDNNALPLSKNNKVSVFGITNQMWMTKEKISGKDTVFLEPLQNAGLEINTELRKFYKQSTHTAWGTGSGLGDGGIAGDWTIDEVPMSEYNDSVKNSYKNYSDAAIIVFSRGGGEGGDLPRNMGKFGGDDNKSYLELTQNELDLLSAIKQQKDANVFKKIILVLHTTNAMQMDFMNSDYGIDSILWVSGTGANGVEVMGKLLTGEINPSGKNVNTYVYDNMSAPSMQNFGDYRFTQNNNLIANNTGVGGTYSYINYGESIYVGYKYYESRYADKIEGAANVGNYDYAKTVYRPFGYGLSYTDFELSDFSASSPDEKGNIDLSVKVTNKGTVAGKEVVQFYYQAPYITGGIEKSALNLVEFEKTDLLKANGS